MGANTFEIPLELLKEALAQKIAEQFPPERLDAIASAAIDQRIQRLTLAELAPRLGCTTERQARDKCYKLGITIHKEFGQKAPYVLLKDVEAKNTARSVVVPIKPGMKSTAIGRVA